jgi:hypothetical protein
MRPVWRCCPLASLPTATTRVAPLPTAQTSMDLPLTWLPLTTSSQPLDDKPDLNRRAHPLLQCYVCGQTAPLRS